MERVLSSNGNPTTMSYTHEQTHMGNMFVWGEVAVSIAAGATLDYGFVTGSKMVHTHPARIVTSADKLTYTVYEGATYSGGTAMTLQNKNRNSLYIPLCSVTKAPTVTATGTSFVCYYLPGATGVGGTRTGSDVSEDEEWVLKPNTKYLVRFTNGSTGANLVTFSLAGYELNIDIQPA